MLPRESHTTLRLLLPLFIPLCLLSFPFPLLAETQTLTAEGTYTMGEGETMTFAESMALQKAKQMALEQAGTYVESYTKVQNYQLTADEIQTVAGGVLQVEVLEKTRTLVGDGLKFFVKINATVTTDKVAELAQRIKGKNVAEEYKKLQEQYAQLLRDMEGLKQQAVKASPGIARAAAIDQIREQEKVFVSVQKKETELFERAFSGETLVAKALGQLAEKQESEKQKRNMTANLLQALQDNGHIITLGEPKPHIDLQYPDEIELWFAMTVEISPSALSVLQQAAKEFGGSIYGTTDEAIGMDSQTANYFRKGLSSWNFTLQWVLDDGKTIAACQDEDHEVIRSVWGLTSYMNYKSSWHETKKKFTVGIDIPTKLAKRITAARGKLSAGSAPDKCWVRFK